MKSLMHHPIVEATSEFSWGEVLDFSSFPLKMSSKSSGFGSLLNHSRLLDLIVKHRPGYPQLRCFSEGEQLNPQIYSQRSIDGKGYVSDVDTKVVGELLDSNATIVLDKIDSLDQRVEVACRGLQWWSQRLVQANAYLTTGETKGFPLHCDKHDLIVVQIEGTKHWKVSGTKPEQEMSESSDEVDTWEGELEPGDLLKVPKGYWHTTKRTEPGHSLHLTFSMPESTHADYFKWLSTKVDESIKVDDASTTQTSKELPIEMFLQERIDLAEPKRQIYSENLDASPEFVSCVSAFKPKILSDSAQRFTVRCAGKEITFNESVRLPVEELLSGVPVEVVVLSKKYGDVVDTLVTTLLSQGICISTMPDSVKDFSFSRVVIEA